MVVIENRFIDMLGSGDISILDVIGIKMLHPCFENGIGMIFELFVIINIVGQDLFDANDHSVLGDFPDIILVELIDE